MMASQSIPDRVIRQMLASAVNLVVHCARLTDGTRKVVSIAEVTGIEGDQVKIEDIFVFEREGISPGGRVLGKFRGQNYRPICGDRIRSYGIKVDDAIYDDVVEVKD